MFKIIRLFSVFSLGLILLLPMSWPSLAQPRTDFYGPGDSGAYYNFYLDWMYPKGKRPFVSSSKIKPLSTKVKPRTDYDGPGDSGAYYNFYLDWMSPRVKPKSPRILPFLTR